MDKLLAEVLRKASEFNSQGVANTQGQVPALPVMDKLLVLSSARKLLAKVLLKEYEFSFQVVANTLRYCYCRPV